MERQQVLYDDEHHYDVILGEQALYTNVSGAQVMQGQVDRLLQDIDLPSVTLGILPATAQVNMLPGHGFNIYGQAGRAHVELVSSDNHREERA